MRKYLLFVFAAFTVLTSEAQITGLVKSDGVMILTTAPTHTPCAVCSELVFSRSDSTLYYYDRPSGPWRKYTFSTDLVQDSILVHYRGTAEVGRDTIRGLSGGGGSTEQADGVTILGDGSSGDPFRADTALLVTATQLADSAAAVRADFPSGGAANVNLDIYRLPAIHQYLAASGLAANESVTNYLPGSVDPTEYKFSTIALGATSTEYGGWLANGTSGDSIAIWAPCGVVIGDSQAEGNPAADSRLTNGGAVFSVNYQDVYGTISYTLRQKTKMRWFNHGIGGQTSDQVWARWSRDVLAQTYNPSDGRGSKTLQRKPNIVVVIVGINDFFVHTTRSWRTTAENLENMAKSARDNGIAAVFLNCPGDESANLIQIRKVDSLNTWMASGALQAFGAAVVDYNSWWRDPTYNDNAHGQALIADVIHPSAVGYDSLANVIFRAAKLPVVTGVKFTNKLSPLGFSGYSRPANITIQGVAHTISSEEQLLSFSTPMAWDSVWVKINTSTNVTGTTYSGFSHIEWLIENDTTDLYTRKPSLYVAYQGTGGSLFSRVGTLIAPTLTTDRLALGTATASASTTILTVQGTTTDATVHTRMQSSAAANPIVFTNNGRIGINRSSASYNLHVSGTAAIEASSTDYWFFNGSTSEVFGANPRFRFQSTSRNTGSTGRTDMDMIWNGNTFTVSPVSTAAGADFRWTFRNKASTYFFSVDLTNQRIGTVDLPAYAVDFSSGRDGIAIPSGSTGQRGSTGGIYGLRMNTDSTQVEITPSALTWNYIPRSAYPVKTSGLAGWGAGGLLTGVTIGSGLSLSGGTLSSTATDTHIGNTDLTTSASSRVLTVLTNGAFRIRSATLGSALRVSGGTSREIAELYSSERAAIYSADSSLVYTDDGNAFRALQGEGVYMTGTAMRVGKNPSASLLSYNTTVRNPNTASTYLLIQSGRDSTVNGEAGLRIAPSGTWSSVIEFGTAMSPTLNFYSYNHGASVMKIGSGSGGASARTVILGQDTYTAWGENAKLAVYDTISTGDALVVFRKVAANTVPILLLGSDTDNRFTFHDSGAQRNHVYTSNAMSADSLGKTASIFDLRTATDGTIIVKATQNNVVSAATDSSGDITVTFATAMPDATYTTLTGLKTLDGTYTHAIHSETTSSFKIRTYASGTALGSGVNVSYSWQVTDY